MAPTWRGAWPTSAGRGRLASGRSPAPSTSRGGRAEEEQPADDLAEELTSGDYDGGSRRLYEVDSENSSREPAHV